MTYLMFGILIAWAVGRELFPFFVVAVVLTAVVRIACRAGRRA